MSCIAYIDDLDQNLEVVKLLFSPEFEVKTFIDPNEFLATYYKHSYNCILTDIHMPEVDGFMLYEKIVAHPQYNGCPILFVSSDESYASKIKSLILGAVDYIDRDTPPEEIVGRTKAKIEYFKQHRSTLELGNLKVNLHLLKVFINSTEISMTFTELKILCFILKEYPNSILKEVMVEKVWNSSLVLDATLSTHMSNLNSKLLLWNHEIQTNKGKLRVIKKKS